MNEMVPTKPLLATCVAALALAAAAMPTRNELKKVQSLVNELMADNISAMKSGKLKPSQVAANAENLARDAQGEAAKFLLYKGAFGLYVQGGSYDEAIRAIGHLTDAVKNVPDNVLAEILREKLKRIPKKNGSAIFNLYDGICRRMNAAKEREKLEKQVKASPADKSARRQLATRCAQMGDWKAACEHFAALGGEEAAAVKAEASNPASAADFWWGFKPDDGVDDDTFREHAAALYRKAIDEGTLSGLKLVLAKKRVAEVAPAAEQSAAPQKNEPAADDAKPEVAAKSRREESKPAARATGGKRIDWNLPKNFKGKRFVDLDLGNGETMTFAAMAGGTGLYHNPNQGDLKPHKVKITRPFWISQFPVTSRQFKMTGINPVPSLLFPGKPITQAEFEKLFENEKDAVVLAAMPRLNAKDYFKWLNEKFGSSLPKGWVFRPPTQGEILLVDKDRSVAPRPPYRKNDSWLAALHSKGLCTEFKTPGEVKVGGPPLAFTPNTLVVDVSKWKKDKILYGNDALEGYLQCCLDCISIPGVDGRHVPFYGRTFTQDLEKALNYQFEETDPFRFVADDAPDKWAAHGQIWIPFGNNHTPALIRVAVGPDLVGEWKAKNGK